MSIKFILATCQYIPLYPDSWIASSVLRTVSTTVMLKKASFLGSL